MKRKLQSPIYQFDLWKFMFNSWKFVFIKTTCVRIVSTYYFIVTYCIFSPKRMDKMM